jgi:integrase
MAVIKRANRDGKPSYQVRIAATDHHTGKRRNITIGTYRTKKEADKAERDALLQQDRGTLADPSKITVGDLLDAWLVHKAASISPNTHKDYEIAVRRHLKPAFGSVKAQRLTAAAVQTQYGAWHTGSMSARMVHRCHVVLSQALAQAATFGTVTRNVCDDVKPPRIERSKPAVWNPQEATAFLHAAMNRPVLARGGDTGRVRPDDLSPLWHLLLLEAMRRGEALGLRWQDVNWERGTVHIVQTVVADKNDKGRAVIQPRAKTASGSRSVRMTAETLAVLREHRDGQALARRAAGDAWQANDLIVCTATGTPINPNNVTRSYKRLVMLAGVADITVHGLRHTAATLLLRAGVPAKIVSERLGHANIAITLDTYSHVLPDMQDIAAEAMSTLLKTNAESA